VRDRTDCKGCLVKNKLACKNSFTGLQKSGALFALRVED
jgi:hypothetical protein